MFRTARGFLLTAPLAFLLALGAYLLSHPQAAEAFGGYPFLQEALGRLSRRPGPRFVATSSLLFLVPYLVTGLLLFLADVGASAAARLWSGKARKRPELPPESLVAYLLGLFGFALGAGLSLHRVPHGGELPGGVVITPVLVAIVPFVGVVVGVALAVLASVPRALARLFSGQPGPTIKRSATAA